MSANRHDPLDADERELARVLRALPAGEPPSALDARILAMARDAVVTTPALKDEAQPRMRRAPRFVWGLGVAASCVMAAGLVWRMGGFGAENFDVAGASVPSDDASAAASSMQPAPPMPEAESEHISVEISPPSTAAPIAPPPPPPAERAPVEQRAVTASAASPPAANAMSAEADEPLSRLRDVSVEQQRRESRREQASAEPQFAPAPAAPMADAAMAESESRADESQTLDSVMVTGSRISALSIEHEDGSAGPQTWLQRVRARIERGDEDGARDSLRAFVERYPSKPLPQDLIDFRARVEGKAADAPDPDAG